RLSPAWLPRGSAGDDTYRHRRPVASGVARRTIPRPGVSRNAVRACSAGTVAAEAAISARASSSARPLRYSVLSARLLAAMSSALKPRRRKPSLLVPRGVAGDPATVTYGGT